MLPVLSCGSSTEALLGSLRSAATSRIATAAWRQQHRRLAPCAAASRRAFIPPPPPPPAAQPVQRASPSSASPVPAVPPLAQSTNGHDTNATGAAQLPPPPPPPPPLSLQLPVPGQDKGETGQSPPADVDTLLRTLAAEGMRAGLVRHWSQIEALQSE